ncbi:MAG: hypothetical protein V3U33_05715, partial [candidate division NC10 bacterium]
RAAIREAKDTAGLPLPRTPGEEHWHRDPLAVAAGQPLPSGHGRNAVPELQGLLRRLVKTSPTSILDTSPGPGHESGDLEDLVLVDRFLVDLRQGRIPEEWLAIREGMASQRRALLVLARRLDNWEARP